MFCDFRKQTAPMGSQTYRAEDKKTQQNYMENDITDFHSAPQYQHEAYVDDGTYLEPIQRSYPDGRSRTELMVDQDEGQDISEQVSSINLSAPIELAGQHIKSVTVERVGSQGKATFIPVKCCCWLDKGT